MNYTKKVLLANKIKKVANVGTLVLEAAWEIAQNPKPTNIAKHVSNLTKEGLTGYEARFKAKKIRNTWFQVNEVPHSFTEYVVDLFSEDEGPIRLDEGDCHLFEIEGVPAALVDDDRLYISDEDKLPMVTAAIGKAILEDVGTRFTIKSTGKSSWDEENSIMSVPKEPILESPACAAILARVKAFTDKGIHRSLFIYGKPGTGKSCLSTNIADKMEGYQLIMSAEDFVDASDAVQMIEFLKPSVLIINDINYVDKAPAGTLTLLEKVNKTIKLVIVTANTARLDPAVMRPGRFDEVIELTTLGTSAITSIIGESLKAASALSAIDPEILLDLGTWPAAFLKELSLRCTALGPSCFVEEYHKLKDRVAINTEAKDKSLFE